MFRAILSGILVLFSFVSTANAATLSVVEYPVDKAQPKVIEGCIKSGWTVVQATPNSVTCKIPMSMGKSVLSQMLIGNSYSTPPEQLIQFFFASHEHGSQIQTSSWIETQMAFGQMRRQELSGRKIDGQVAQLMSEWLPPTGEIEQAKIKPCLDTWSAKTSDASATPETKAMATQEYYGCLDKAGVPHP